MGTVIARARDRNEDIFLINYIDVSSDQPHIIDPERANQPRHRNIVLSNYRNPRGIAIQPLEL
jgi:hypothetical protein